ITLSWFKSIPPGSISDWRALSRRFTTHFVNNKRRIKTSRELMVLRQKGESLREYTIRFDAKTVTIPNLQQEVDVLALMSGL
ncbi:TraB domain-containing protein, partial [Bienertia sinuspersici]